MDPLEGLEDCRFCEVYLCLPPDWPMAPELRLDRAEGWPVRLLAELAQHPHRSGEWIWFGHTHTASCAKTRSRPLGRDSRPLEA